jgi:hypothetical protein
VINEKGPPDDRVQRKPRSEFLMVTLSASRPR